MSKSNILKKIKKNKLYKIIKKKRVNIMDYDVIDNYVRTKI